ncbi:MAG: STAS domain-containing protein [Methanobacterium sp.]|jgi:anti-sigma B factor antagonist|uniref:STAS domain-containing protein n=1 Tax=Methanobacterium sp. TaxID=2164 RepID=UPI00258C49E5|nr:STAS domain-containing protein [Methanobacterium sp.]MCC7560891.1 STAS domain-containing protein [Methanobacterium sp.]
MNIEKTREGNKLTIKLDGRLDTNTAPELEKELKEALPGVGDLVFDFSDLKYISSAGLRLILSTQKTMNQQGTLVIKNVNDMVMEIFETTGFSDVLTIKETEPLN